MSAARTPVNSGNRRVPGLYERRLADGTIVYDAALRLGGQVRRRRLRARTQVDAIAELRALQVDHERGEAYRSPAGGLTLAELTRDYIAAPGGPARTRPTLVGAAHPRTVEDYESPASAPCAAAPRRRPRCRTRRR